MEIRAIKITEFGVVPRALKAIHRTAAKESYRLTGETFHTRFAPLRFTAKHGKEAGYRKRSGENLAFGTRAFWRSYFGRKIQGGRLPDGRMRQPTTAPLVWSGDTRAAARMATNAATANRVEVRYTFRALNYIPWAREEFSKVLEREAIELGQQFDTDYHVRFNGTDRTTTVIS